MMNNCPFCAKPENEYFTKGEYFFAVFDQYPVSEGHLLVIPFRHIAGIGELAKKEEAELIGYIKMCKDRLYGRFSPNGFNIGINEGYAGGQTIPHLHIHIIPRYSGDVAEPEGGVRGVIPEKRKYRHLIQESYKEKVNGTM